MHCGNAANVNLCCRESARRTHQYKWMPLGDEFQASAILVKTATRSPLIGDVDLRMPRNQCLIFSAWRLQDFGDVSEPAQGSPNRSSESFLSSANLTEKKTNVAIILTVLQSSGGSSVSQIQILLHTVYSQASMVSCQGPFTSNLRSIWVYFRDSIFEDNIFLFSSSGSVDSIFVFS